MFRRWTAHGVRVAFGSGEFSYANVIEGLLTLSSVSAQFGNRSLLIFFPKTMERASIIDWGAFDAVLFDLDGVLTATARVHAGCWKTVFDQHFLLSSGVSDAHASRPFELPHDYRQYVDGKPRYDGVRSFLSSRGVWLPDGTPLDLPAAETICGLGNKKSLLFTEAIQAEGVETYPDAVALARYLRKRDIKLGVVSSSRHCESILVAAGLQE